MAVMEKNWSPDYLTKRRINYFHMESEHFIGKVGVRAIIVKEGMVLLAKDRGDMWEIPGGRMPRGENIQKALKREILEELGVAIEVGPLVYSEQISISSEPTPHLSMSFAAWLVDEDALFKVPSEEVIETRWIDATMVNGQKLYPDCVRALEAYWKGE